MGSDTRASGGDTSEGSSSGDLEEEDGAPAHTAEDDAEVLLTVAAQNLLDGKEEPALYFLSG